MILPSECDKSVRLLPFLLLPYVSEKFLFFRYEAMSCHKILFHHRKEHEKTNRMSGQVTFYDHYNTMKNASERVIPG